MKYQDKDYEGKVIEINGESTVVEMITDDLKVQEVVFHTDSLKKCDAAHMGAKIIYNPYKKTLKLDKSLISKLFG